MQWMRIIALCAITSLLGCKSNGAKPTDAAAAATLPLPAPAAIVLPDGRSIADIAAKVTPSVVTISSERTVALELSPFLREPLFEFFFDQPGPRETPRQRQKGVGSGVILSADGVIVTNHHVVDGAENIQVTLHDGRTLDGKVVGSDPRSDLAVVKVDATGLTALPVADSAKLRVGDLVLAVGNPFGVGQTVTMGIISAVGRVNLGIVDYEDFIQTDAAINPGNSGGALVDMDGQLVGINTAIVSRTGGYQGVGFAIPSRMALHIKDAILRDGKVVRGWLGVAIQDVTRELAAEMDLGVDDGVLVSDVTAGGPAAKAGILRGDVITAVDGVETRDSGQLRNLIAMAGKDKQVRIELVRDRASRSIDVTLGELPASEDVAVTGESPPGTEAGVGPLAGVTVAELDASVRARLGLDADVHGVVVTEVDGDSAAAEAGLRRGDVIVEVDRQQVTTVDAYRRAAKAAKDRTLLLIEREGTTHYVVVRPR